MLTTIADHISPDKQLHGDEVTVDQIKKLSKKYFTQSWIEESEILRRVSCDDRNNPKKNDTRTITFKKSRIDEFFAANPGTDDFVIHIGIHDKTIYDGGQPKEYEGKVMVVLSPLDVKKLKKGDKVMIAGITGGGVDNGKLCPPDQTCPV